MIDLYRSNQPNKSVRLSIIISHWYCTITAYFKVLPYHPDLVLHMAGAQQYEVPAWFTCKKHLLDKGDVTMGIGSTQ